MSEYSILVAVQKQVAGLVMERDILQARVKGLETKLAALEAKHRPVAPALDGSAELTDIGLSYAEVDALPRQGHTG